MSFNRDEAWKILRQHVQDQALLKHCLAVEIAMRAYAGKFGEDVDYWGTVGILHDVDFEKYPDEHPGRAPSILSSYGYDQEFITNVLAHGPKWEEKRTILQKTLVAVDALTGFILACALVRPDKSLDNLEAKSVMKKLKDNSFARAINRDVIINSAKDLGVDMYEHIDFVRKALAEAIANQEFKNVKLIG